LSRARRFDERSLYNASALDGTRAVSFRPMELRDFPLPGRARAWGGSVAADAVCAELVAPLVGGELDEVLAAVRSART